MKNVIIRELWESPFFLSLTKRQKLFWIWVLNTSDEIGVWEKNLEQFRAMSGFKIDEDDLKNVFGSRMILLENGSFFVPLSLKIYKENQKHFSPMNTPEYDRRVMLNFVNSQSLLG